MAWSVIAKDEVADWYRGLDPADQDAVEVAVSMLEEHGPGLGRPWVDSIKGSTIHHLKELRPRGGAIRLLFAFDPRREAILLLGGDKANRWGSWYTEAIPVAEARYRDYLEQTGQT